MSALKSGALDAIAATFAALRDAHTSGNEAAIAAATRDLEQLGLTNAVAAALKQSTRDAIVCLCQFGWRPDRIGDALGVPTGAVEVVVDSYWRQLRADEEEHDRYRREERQRELERERSVECPACGVAPGRACRMPSGKRSRESHSARRAMTSA